MGNHVKDEGKKMDPLFPRLHISEADKGGPRTPPRNKMSVSQQFNVPSQTAQMCNTRSVSPVLPFSTNNGGSLVPATSSYHDASCKRSVFSSFGRSCGSTRLATRLDSYHSSGINLNISLTTVKQTIETTNCQTLCNVGHLKRGDYNIYKPQEFGNARNTSLNKVEDEDEYLVPNLSFGNGKFPTLNTNSHVEHLTLCQKQVKPTDTDTSRENKLNTPIIKDITKEPMSCYYERVQFSESSQDPNIRLPLKRKSFSFQENMACKNGAKGASNSIWPLLEDNGKSERSNHEAIAPNNKSKEGHGSLHLEDVGKIGDVLETNVTSGYNITPEEVSQLIGHEQYCRARKTIVLQQRIFQSQLFELHRLIKVQKLLAESPDLLLEDNFYKLKKTPPEDIFAHVDHRKKESYINFPVDNIEADKRYNPTLIDLPLAPPPPPSTTKQPPWCFLPPPPPPPPGNQWLVPVRSPSEGLVYKPYTGPSPPPVGLMTPVYSMSLAPPNNDFLTTNAYTIPTTYQHTPLFTSYGLSTITNRSCSPTIEYNDINYSKNVKIGCNLSLTQENKESELQGSNSYERKKDELPLFPTTPMVQDSDQCTNEKIKVIKVVPHNPKLASQSAARIFQFIQEERKNSE